MPSLGYVLLNMFLLSKGNTFYSVEGIFEYSTVMQKVWAKVSFFVGGNL